MKTKLITILLCLFPLLAYAQNYEQKGDELFAEAQYEQAVKKYNAAVVSVEMDEKKVSSQLTQKKEKCSQCASLLSRAKAAEESASTPADYENASKLYSDLFALHALQTYKNKANTLKQKANAIIAQQKKTERERAKTYVNGHRAVDMGLSVRWADCNVGANHSYDTGDYYAWGETSTKVSFPWNTYKHISNGKLIKYCSNSSSGRVDNKRILETQDDAAYVNWGNAWRIPTKEQWEELADNNKCKWEWTTDSGVYGYKVTSKITGNSIFLPVTGYKPGGTRIEHPELGLYWTSTLFTGQYDNGYLAAYRFDLGQTHYNCRGTHRCNGRAIRAVCR